MSDSSGSNRLQVMRAVEDGWKAFGRSPWPFVLFTLLAGVLSMLFQAIANAASGDSFGAGAAIATIISVVGSTVVSLWAVSGLIRGAWRALDGHCLLYTSPSPRDRQKSRMPSSA